MSEFTFHLIPNAHLDPVWLWDWREGLNEGIVTCRTILDLMDENKDLTFIRGRIVNGNRLQFGIESFFVQEGTGHKYEQAVRNRKLSAEIYLDSSGNAGLKLLVIE